MVALRRWPLIMISSQKLKSATPFRLEGERRMLLKRGPNRDGQLVLAFVFARAADVEQARKLADTVSQSAPLATLVRNYCLPTIQAAIKLDQHDPAAAVEILRAAAKVRFVKHGLP